MYTQYIVLMVVNPRKYSHFHESIFLVALGQFSPSNQILEGRETTSVATSARLVSPPRQRRRLTARLRAAVVEAYEAGQTSRQVAEELGLGRSTVLGILKDAGVAVRPQGQKY